MATSPTGLTAAAPRISIILSTHNRAHLLARAIKSVLCQTVPTWELIVVDDGSTDGTGGVVQSFTDPRIQYLPRVRNRGVAAARNTGLSAARGDLVSFLDSDDEYLPMKLERQVEALAARPGVEVVECALRLATESREEIVGPFLAGMNFDDFLSFEHGINIAALLMRRELAVAVGFDEGIKVDDWDFVLRLLARTRATVIDDPLVVIHNLPGQRLSTSANIMAGRQQVIRKYEDTLKNRPRVLARWHHRLAFFHIGLGDLVGARRELLLATRLWPCNVIRWVLLLATLLGDDVFALVLRTYRQAGRIKQRLRHRPRTSRTVGAGAP